MFLLFCFFIVTDFFADEKMFFVIFFKNIKNFFPRRPSIRNGHDKISHIFENSGNINRLSVRKYAAEPSRLPTSI